MVDWQLRLRRTLNRRFTLIVVILVIGLLTGGWVSYTSYVAVEPTIEDRTSTIWETTGEFDHETVVEEPTPVFPEGSRLTDRSLYFTRISPRLLGRFRSSYAGTPNGTLNRTISVSLIVRAVDRQGGDTEFWRTTRRLNRMTVENVDPEEQITVSFSQNMTSLNNRIDQINEQLGATVGEIEVLIRTTVDSQGTVNNRAVNKTNDYTMPVELNENTYRVVDAEPTTEAYETNRTETVEPTPGARRQIGGPGLVVASLIALGGLVVSRRRGFVGLSDIERKRLAYQEHREEFDDWISSVELPDEAFDLPEGEADSLTALVDIAIDTNNSVIEDPKKEVYYVRHNGYLYRYRPPAQTADVVDETGETNKLDTASQKTNEASQTDEAAGADDRPSEKPVDESGGAADDPDDDSDGEADWP